MAWLLTVLLFFFIILLVGHLISRKIKPQLAEKIEKEDLKDKIKDILYKENIVNLK